MILVICPGIHDTALTEAFLREMRSIASGDEWSQPLVFPTARYPAYSSPHVLNFLMQQPGGSHPAVASPLMFIGFSAGVVGAIGAAWAWQLGGGAVQGVIAIDGWGVPLYGNFPIHRLSHDRFTYWSSALLGAGQSGFYADPIVDHLDLWRSPHTVEGWWRSSNVTDPLLPAPVPRRLTAAEAIAQLVGTGISGET